MGKKERLHILTITEEIVKDPVLLMCMGKLFDYANMHGLNGVKLSNLRLSECKSDLGHPLCKFDCLRESDDLT